MFVAVQKLLPAVSLWLCLTLVIGEEADVQITIPGQESWKPMKPKKRQANIKLDLAGSATAKSYEPPPEFYRGPGSSSTSKLDNTAASFISKPISSLPSPGLGVGGGVSGSGGAGVSHLPLHDVNENLSEAYDKWRQGNGGGTGGLQDRISVGHYGSKSYAYDSHPYPYEYGGPGPGPAPGYGSGYGSSSSEAGLPYHVYRPRPEHGNYGPGGDYSYGYSYPVEHHEIVSHKGSSELSPKALLAKSFLIPLAGATVLGIAAALISNPLLLQLAPVPGLGVGVGVGPPIVGKRKRRRRALRANGNGAI
ncbi:uncharacterized protein Dwil_GK26879 [Drosophila willistoni]|uniref:uncharacterized protein LOC26528881 n=1 Tax=Drosophila willistoni TaxID=7260 RepID=UPI0007326F57|nr:uncharacterized protein LOC26528881 [Drosophila willistoni]KRF99073.1 uncharacterized protein Dwil_GK26879 [Drosophila willistoni]